MAPRKPRLNDLYIPILVASGIIFAAGSRQAGRSASIIQSPMPGPDAQQLWRYITQENPYKSWKNFPNMPGRFVHVKENPHGDWVAAYLNDAAYESIAFQSHPFQMKYGSIVVKENYSPVKGDPVTSPPLTSVPVTLTSLTIMYKIKGYQRVPAEEEWFWVMYGCDQGQCDGSVATISNQAFVDERIPKSQDTFAFYQGEVVAGKPWLCVECHQRARQSTEFAVGDYLWKLKPFAPK
jgi:hypothetical protein